MPGIREGKTNEDFTRRHQRHRAACHRCHRRFWRSRAASTRRSAATASRTPPRKPRAPRTSTRPTAHLTFAIVTHTAGNGFFDPVYVGATVAGNMIGAKILLLGSESPTDDPAREIEILNQIVNDPTLDGLIMTTPQVGAYDDIVTRRGGERHPDRHHQLVRRRHPQPQRHQPHRPGRFGGRHRRRGAGAVPDRPRRHRRARSSCRTTPRWATSKSTTASPRPTTRSSRRSTKAGKLANFQVDAGPENVGVDGRHERSGQLDRLADRVARRRGRRLRRQQRLHPGARQGRRPDRQHRQDLRLRLRPRPGTAGSPASPAT